MSDISLKEKILNRGWSVKEVQDRWCIGARQMYNLNKNPKQKDFDAVRGLNQRKVVKKQD